MSLRWGLLLLLPAWVTTATSVTRCGSDKYELKSLGLCCPLCPAGQYVSKHCDGTQSTQCSPCEPDTFMAHPNSETSCLLSAQCRDDQEEVTSWSPTRDRQCQCKTGSYYCDSGDCVEMCYPCTRCEGATLQPCNATANAICAAETSPVPGNPNKDSVIPVPLWVLVFVGTLIFIGIVVIIVVVIICCCRRRGVQLWQPVANFLKKEWSESGSHSYNSSLPNEVLPPTDPERHPAALGVNSPLLNEGPALAPELGSRPVPCEDPEDGTELQVLVVKGSDTAPEQASQAHAPAACVPQGQAEASASFCRLQQEYERKYYLKDTSCDVTNRIYYEFGHKVPESHWKMLMRFVGLENNDIEICEHENPGNLMEQHHKMLLRWGNKLGREASVFTLMAALHQMELYVYLQNIVNKLVADNILGRHAETPN
ncbi:tumor necrosis factor receptor superfamily member 10A-like [Hipposideros larvatus]